MSETTTSTTLATPTYAMGIFQQQADSSSIRSIGIAIAIAMLVLFAMFIFLVIAAIFVRRNADRRAALDRTPSTMRAPRTSLFPLSFPSLRSKGLIHRTNSHSSQHQLVSRSRGRLLHRDFSDASTLTSSTKSGKDSIFTRHENFDLEAQVMPLPPPPSYQDVHMTGPVHSISGSSWITEGPAVESETPCKPKGRGRRDGRATRRI